MITLFKNILKCNMDFQSALNTSVIEFFLSIFGLCITLFRFATALVKCIVFFKPSITFK